MEAMVAWHHERYLDPEVWNRLPEKINPALMPAPSVLQSLPPPPPPGGVEYSALHHLPDPSRGTRLPLEYHSEVIFCHCILADPRGARGLAVYNIFRFHAIFGKKIDQKIGAVPH